MLFYFSATGNTRMAAQRIATALDETLYYIPDEMGKTDAYTLQPNERIGFCFPVHGWRPPLLVRQFVRQLTFDTSPQGHYIWALCTAGDTIGTTMQLFEHDLTDRQWHLDAAFTLIMPETYVGLPGMDVDTPENEQRKKREAAIALTNYIPLIVQRQKGVKRLVIGRWPHFKSGLIGDFFIKHLIDDHRFRVDLDRCIRCGACVTVCPVHNMTGGKGVAPQWLHSGRCLTCFACYHRCPRHAIAFGRWTKGKGQYRF